MWDRALFSLFHIIGESEMIKNQYLLTKRKWLVEIIVLFAAITANSAFALSNKPQEHDKHPMTVNVIVTFVAKEERIEEFAAIMNQVKNDLPKVEGCSAVAIFRSSTEENKFTVVETWESKELHQTHINKVINDGAWDMITSLLYKEPESDYYIVVQ